MSTFSNNHKVDFKISQPNTYFLIGSNSIHSSGDLYMLDMNNINRNNNIRSKRLLDFISALFLLLSYPLLFLIYRHPLSALKSILKVIIGTRTWVGYSIISSQQKLPKIKSGILHISDGVFPINDDISAKLNIVYAKDYSVVTDLRVLSKNLKLIGATK